MMSRVAGLVLLCLCFSGNVWAQSGLPPQVTTEIRAAAHNDARNEMGRSGFLLSRVNASIVYYPAYVEEIIATAVEAAPQYGDQIVEQTIWAFPGYSHRILTGAKAARSVTAPVQWTAVPHAAYSAAPPPVQMAQSYSEEQAVRDAGNFKRFYTDFSAGFTEVQDADLTDPWLTARGLSGGLTADIGFNLNGAVGYKFSNGWRSDFEIGYRRSALEQISVGGFGLTAGLDVNGTVSALSFLLNGYYDFALSSPLTPYVGGGLGFALVNLESSDLSADETDTLFAYQLGAGLKHPLGPRTSLRGGYRFFTTADPTFDTTEGEYLSHNFEIGLTYAF